MTKLAFFEKKEEKNALRIGRYFRSDYIGKELLKNFFLASIGYILVLAVAVLYHIEWLVDEIDTIDLQFAAGCLIASYLCFLAVYSIAVYVISTIRYQGAQKKLKWYGKELDDLQNIYEEQEKSGKKSGRAVWKEYFLPFVGSRGFFPSQACPARQRTKGRSLYRRFMLEICKGRADNGLGCGPPLFWGGKRKQRVF